MLDTSLRGFALQKKCLSEIGVISESPRAGDPVNLTQDAQHTVSIAKIGVWNMHLPQIKGQINVPLLPVLSLTRQLTCHKMEHSKSLDDRRCGPDNGRLLILSCIKEDTRVWYRLGLVTYTCMCVYPLSVTYVCMSYITCARMSHVMSYV